MTILNSNQSRQYKRSTTLNVCLTKYNGILNEYPPFSEETELFTQNNQRLIDLVSGKIEACNVSLRSAIIALSATT